MSLACRTIIATDLIVIGTLSTRVGEPQNIDTEATETDVSSDDDDVSTDVSTDDDN